jgi:asparagine synthase (glutamine-hydrolysing)
MCGIAGLIGERAGVDAAARVPALLRHRGPDGAGVAELPGATLVATRLALVDPAPHALPLQSPDGRFTLLFNGEVYNHAALRRELPFPYRTHTDTEVALAALLAWGPAALSRFEGMFALFLWDRDLRRGFAAVDPLGIKPFLFHTNGEELLFCSEAGPLLTSGLLPFRPHHEAIAEYLTAPYFSGARQLPFANLSRLLPGHYLEWEAGRIRTSRYRHSATAPDDLLAPLRAAVAAQSTADANVGLFLSGGVDSSLLAALAPRPMPAFTIQYPGQPSDYTGSLIVTSDDVPFAVETASRFGHPHHLVSPADFEASLMRTLWTNDLIAAWEQEVSQNELALAAAAAGVKAVLVGDAADETHYGYSFLLHPERIASPARLLDYFGTLPTRPEPAHFVDSYTRFAEQEGHEWSTPDAQRHAITSLIQRLWLPRLLHNGDIQLMAHSVEGRVPYSDPALLAFAGQVPLSAALHDGIEKHHLRAAAAAVLPAGIAWRPKSALTKNLAARAIIHRRFRQAWKQYGEWLEPYIDAASVDRLGPPANDRDTGLQFRLLALLTWFARFSNEST